MKWTIIVGLWRKYKSHVLASCALLLSLILINYVHLDYVEYSVATGTNNLGFSYLLKWSAFILVAALYVVHIKRVNAAAKYDSRLHKMMKTKPTATHSEKSQSTQEQNEETKANDPFANIRSKKKLSSEADFLIGKDK
jgi:hypothetical protein